MFVTARAKVLVPRYLCRLCSNVFAEPAAPSSVAAVNEGTSGVESKRDVRDVSRLDRRAHMRGIKGQYTAPENEFEYYTGNMRRDYARYGRSTGLNPGILWPSKEQLRETAYYEAKFYPSIRELLDNEKAKRDAEAEEARKREQEVERNIAKVKEWRFAMLEREAKKKAAAEEQRIQREELIREVREYIGYNVEPSDPKFQEVMEMKEEERKQAAKEARKKAKQERMLARLMAVGAVDQKTDAEKAAEDRKPEEGAKKVLEASS
ncbi:hypothetical protein HPB47_025301 [Ixodes persulcatus]|uniref:Uncharacterized protein n=1 Tax=Ixodes persulcatus TaxID=34615 RepID=A0AC60Q3P2_IXOPE|nr:hypothetical protein HPB47_025301 [Ixodes persulcatus]